VAPAAHGRLTHAELVRQRTLLAFAGSKQDAEQELAFREAVQAVEHEAPLPGRAHRSSPWSSNARQSPIAAPTSTQSTMIARQSKLPSRLSHKVKIDTIQAGYQIASGKGARRCRNYFYV
jgi:hypothetical protein